MSSDHDYNLVITLTSDGSGDATHLTKSQHGLIAGVYLDYIDAEVTCDFEMFEIVGLTQMPIASELGNNTDIMIRSLIIDPWPVGGQIKMTLTNAGANKTVKVFCKIV